jgi:hypothetical protein
MTATQLLPTTPARHVRRGDVVVVPATDDAHSTYHPHPEAGVATAVLRIERAYFGYPTLAIHTEVGVIRVQPDVLLDGHTAWAREGLS